MKGKVRAHNGVHHSSILLHRSLNKKYDYGLASGRPCYCPEILRLLLEKAGDIQIVTMAANGQEAVVLAGLHSPNVAVINVSMPTMNGIEATKKIHTNFPHTSVLMISMYDTSAHIQSSLQAGASGYVLKDEIGDELVIAVRTIYQGNQYFSKQIAEIAKHFIQ